MPYLSPPPPARFQHPEILECKECGVPCKVVKNALGVTEDYCEICDVYTEFDPEEYAQLLADDYEPDDWADLVMS